MKVGPKHIAVTVRFEDNGKIDSMYVVKYLADRHNDGCLSAYIRRAVGSWIKLHHEKDLLEENVARFIDETKGSLTGLKDAQEVTG